MFLDTVEAGIVLQGTEVKSCREGHVQLDGSYAVVRNGEVWLVGSNIEEYTFGNRLNHKPKRDRKLLPESKKSKNLQIRPK
jgi:SsrA-binding protein